MKTRRTLWCLVIFGALLSVGSTVCAHEVRPAYLQLHQSVVETYDVFWKVPGRGDNMRLSLDVEMPKNCSNTSKHRGVFGDNTFIEEWSVKCAGGLTGGTIQIAGLNATMTEVLVRLERLDGTTQVMRLIPAAPSFIVEAAPRTIQVAGTYLRFGVEHILTGIDHLLYILAMLLLVKGWRRVIATMTA